MRIIIELDENKMRPAYEPPVPEPKKEEPENADLQLKLLNFDQLDESEQMQVSGEVVLYARKLIKSKKKSTLLKFLKSVKHSLTDDMRDLISEELKLA